jgi:hypothetical protein
MGETVQEEILRKFLQLQTYRTNSTYKPGYVIRRSKFIIWLRALVRADPLVITTNIAYQLWERDHISENFKLPTEFDEFYEAKEELMQLIDNTIFETNLMYYQVTRHYAHQSDIEWSKQIVVSLNKITRSGWTMSKEIQNNLEETDQTFRSFGLRTMFEQFWLVRQRA